MMFDFSTSGNGPAVPSFSRVVRAVSEASKIGLKRPSLS